MGLFIRRFGNYDVDAASDEAGLKCEDESRTVQSQREDADINVIVKRFGVTGQLPVIPMPPLVGDFDAIFDFRSAQDTLIAARNSFMALPADVRNRFNNDPHLFVEFCSDGKNLDEMRKLGLAVPKKEEPAPAPAPAPAP